MKVAIQNAIRAQYLSVVLSAFEGEDVGLIASNAFNFPIVIEDGEEGWVEVTVKVPKDDGDEGYGKREEYALKVAAKAEREAAKEAKRKAAKEVKG